jgi:hypothetical protein
MENKSNNIYSGELKTYCILAMVNNTLTYNKFAKNV